jgi:two-component system, sensor histidine kinase
MDDHARPSPASGRSELDELRERLAEAEDTLDAIRRGEVDGLLISDGSGDHVYTLRGADAPYRALVEQMHEGAVTLGAHGDVVYCNRRFAELVQTPMGQVIGGGIDRFVPADEQPAVAAIVRAGAGTLRTQLARPSGSRIAVQISGSTVTLDGVTHRTLIVTDISTLAQVQRENRSKDEFLATLAHELRNPLGAIGGAGQVLGLLELTEPRAVWARDVIQRQVQHMARLVDDLLDVGRVVTGKITLDMQLVELAATVTSSVNTLRASLGMGPRVNLALEPAWVRGDPVRLEQIVGNLLSNALKFTPPQAAVCVSVCAEANTAVLRIADRGRGISPDLLPHIFDLFVQAETPAESPRSGLGIGLTLVRRLAELHGGTVEAASNGEDQGATFTVRLPLVAEEAASITAGPAAAERLVRRILVVDDNDDVRTMNALLLQAEGHEVHEAANGGAALALFRQMGPDVALVDIGLPGMDGYEVARRIREEPEGQRVRLIAVTGHGSPEDRVRSLAAGFDVHLVKPVAPEELRRELERTEARV